MTPRTLIHLGRDRHAAILAWIVEMVGTIEVPLDYPVPTDITFLADNLPPRHAAPSADYARNGGIYWPDRYLVTGEP